VSASGGANGNGSPGLPTDTKQQAEIDSLRKEVEDLRSKVAKAEDSVGNAMREEAETMNTVKVLQVEVGGQAIQVRDLRAEYDELQEKVSLYTIRSLSLGNSPLMRTKSNRFATRLLTNSIHSSYLRRQVPVSPNSNLLSFEVFTNSFPRRTLPPSVQLHLPTLRNYSGIDSRRCSTKSLHSRQRPSTWRRRPELTRSNSRSSTNDLKSLGPG